MADTVANTTFQGADVDWYINVDDITLKKQTSVVNQNHQSQANKNNSNKVD